MLRFDVSRCSAAAVLAVLTMTGCDAPSATPRSERTVVAEPSPAPQATAPSAAGEVATYDPTPLPNAMDSELSAERAFQLTLPKADHPTWNRFRATRVSIDEATQLYAATHPPEVRALAGRTITVRGYMMPLEAAERTTHFLVSPYTPVCLFHPPAEPNEVVEVRTRAPIEAGYHLVEVTGAFALADNGEKGLFFQLSGAKAKIVERVSG